MTKKTVMIVFMLFLFVSFSMAGVSIGGGAGLLSFGANDDLGWCANVRTNYKFSQKFGVAFSLEHFAWDKERLNNYDELASFSELQFTAVSYGILYYFPGEKAKPYLGLYQGYNFGFVKNTFYFYDQNSSGSRETHYSEYPSNGPEVCIGCGFSYPLYKKTALYLNLTYYYPRDWNSHVIGRFVAHLQDGLQILNHPAPKTAKSPNLIAA